jgi:hypothetical protein
MPLMLLTNSFIYSSHGMAAATSCVRPGCIDSPDKNCLAGKMRRYPKRLSLRKKSRPGTIAVPAHVFHQLPLLMREGPP